MSEHTIDGNDRFERSEKSVTVFEKNAKNEKKHKGEKNRDYENLRQIDKILLPKT